MEQGYYIREGIADEVKSWMVVLRGCTQFYITVRCAQVQHTRFGKDYLRQIERTRHNKELLAPQVSVRGFTLEDFFKSPTYHLELVDAGNSMNIRIEGGEECSYTPSYDICPIPTMDLPEACKSISRLKASSISIAPSRQEMNPLRSVQGKVVTVDGAVMYFKPRTAGREIEFEREIRILCRAKELGLNRGQIRLPDLLGIAVSDEKGVTTIGMLMTLIISPKMGTHLLSEQFWSQHELHHLWEEQVIATVQQLHANQIVWGDVNPCNVVIDKDLNAWVIDFGGMNNPEFVDDDKAETMEGDWQGIQRLFHEWLPRRAV
ncbi:hypothetical protein MBLNU459_g3931t1 [Dothideomycetes sp. NU459]